MGIALRAVLLPSSLLVTVRATGCFSFLSSLAAELIIPLLPTICQLSGSKSHICAGRCMTVHPLRIILFLNELHRHCRIQREQLKSASAPLIRARSVVQVHPGPPFKSPVNTRLFSLFPFSGKISQKTILPKICQKFGYATVAIIQGAPTRDEHEHPKSTKETLLICSILDAHFGGMCQR